jgi:hypothetical protein
MKRRPTSARRRHRWWRRLPASWRALPPVARALLALAVLAGLTVAYQVVRKPTELLAVVPTSAKAPATTWSTYGFLFRQHSTDLVSPELLAALVQAESAGDPLARTFWRWHWSLNPLDLYGPASSAVGLLQITDGNFAEARHLCIQGHRVAREGPWLPRACWLNGLYVRWSPSDAIEMTAAWLDQAMRETLGERRARTTPERRRQLAAVIHLCGRRRGASFARHGFRTLPGERCGEHGLAEYLTRVGSLAAEFSRLAASN